MSAVAFIGVALLTFVVLVTVLGLIPAWLSVRTVKGAANGSRQRMRIIQSNMALLAIVGAAAVFLGIHQLVAYRAAPPFFLVLAPAGAVLVISSIATYVWLERQIP